MEVSWTALSSHLNIDGRTQGSDPQQLPDWVDTSVADWIKSETALMDEYWGPADRTRGALAFVHIPP